MAGWKKYLGTLGRNRSLKLLSLALAIAAWLILGAEEQIETTLPISLELVNIPKDLVVMNEIPAQIEVRAQGRRSAIRDLTNQRLLKRIDLTGYGAGSQVFPLNLNSLELPRDVSVNRIRPNSITVVLDHAQVRQLEVQAITTGKPAPEYKLESIDLSPSTISIRGPEKTLAQLTALKTAPIDISNLKNSVTRKVDLDFQNHPLTYVDNKPVSARITIKPRQETKTFHEVKVSPSGAAGPVRLFPPQVALTVEGPAPMLKTLEAEDLNPQVDLHNLKPGRHRLKVAVDPPDDITIIRIQPATIRVRLSPAQSAP